MDEQLHFGQGKDGRSLWHSNQDGTLWNGWRYSGVEPQHLIAELESTLADLYAHYGKPATQPPRASGEREQMIAFLMGMGEIDGVAFGERHPTERGVFWWRNRLRAALAPSPGVDAAEQKPVAWRWSWPGYRWAYEDAREPDAQVGKSIEPLFAAPSPAASADEWMAEAERLVEALALTWDRSIVDMSAARAALLAHLKARP